MNEHFPAVLDIERCEEGVTFDEFIVMDERELKRCLDLLRFVQGTRRTADDYRDELYRRAAERQGRRLECLTIVLVGLTIAIAALTAVLVWMELGH
jgi:hypothetical protein